MPWETDPIINPSEASWSSSRRVRVMLVDISITWVISPALFRMGAVETSRWYCSPFLAVTTFSSWWVRPSANVLRVGQSRQGSPFLLYTE